MGLPTGECEVAFLARYRGDSTLTGLIGASSPIWNIFDEGGVPTNTLFPYVVVVPITTKVGTALYMGGDASDPYMQVGCYTQAAGLKTARAIMKQVYSLTHGPIAGQFTLANGFTNFLTLFENEVETQAPDGLTQMIVQRYHLMTVG